MALKEWSGFVPRDSGAYSMTLKPLPVNRSLAYLLSQVSARTLYTVAYYHELPSRHDIDRLALVDGIAAAMVDKPLAGRLRALLDPTDLLLLERIWRDGAGDVLAESPRFPWQLHRRWPDLATLTPLERLMALGYVLPVRRAGRVDLEVPAEVSQALAYLRSKFSEPGTVVSVRTDAGETPATVFGPRVP